MTGFVEGRELEICYLLAGVLITLISLSFGRRAEKQTLFIIGAIMGSVIALAAIASLIEFSQTNEGKISASFKRQITEKTDRLEEITQDLKNKSAQLKEITDDLDKRNVQLEDATSKIKKLGADLETAIVERTRAEGKINQSMQDLSSQVRTFVAKVNELSSKAGSAPVATVPSSQKSFVALITNESAIEEARRLKDRLVAKGFAAAVRPTDLSDRDRSFPAGTINIVFLASERASAEQVKSIIDDAGHQGRLNFNEVKNLRFDPLQVVLW